VVAAEERILAATMAALAELDPAAVTIKRICAAADVTPPTVYYHFGSKEGLVGAAVQRLAAHWVSVTDASVDRAMPVDAALAQAIGAWTAAVVSPSRPLAVFSWATLLLSRSSDPARKALVEARDHARGAVAELLAMHIAPMQSAEAVAGLITDALLAAAVQYELEQDAEELRRRLEAIALLVRLAVAQSDSAPTGQREPVRSEPPDLR
jgi:AcrR family transcriptional regulator